MKMTVLVLTYRRPQDLKRCLKALQQQNCAADEVLAIVRDIDHETHAFLKAFNPMTLPLRTVTLNAPGVIAAINAGFAAAAGETIAITDDDAAPHPDWLERIKVNFQADERLGGVGGRDYVYLDTQLVAGAEPIVGKLQWFGRMVGNHHLGIGSACEVDLLKGVNMSFRKSAIAGLRCDERLKGSGAHQAERAHTCVNGVPEEFIGLPYEPTPLNENTVIRIAQLSNYISRKGIYYGVPALNQILARYPQVMVSLIGTRCSEAEVYADFNPAVREQVKVIPRYNHETLPALLQGHHIKLLPTLAEGFSVALVDAMACGLAPVTTATPGPMEIVQDGKNGIFVAPRDTEAIVQASERLISDRPYLEQLRRTAHATAQHYSWDRIARDNLALYEEALSQRRGSQ